MRETRGSRRLIFFVVLPMLLAAASLAPAASAMDSVTVVDHPADVYPAGQDMYQALNHGEALECDHEPPETLTPGCQVTAKVAITRAEKRYLGLSTRTIAKGVAHGPVSMRLMGSMHHNLFILPIPAWFRTKLLAKHVVSMNVLVTAKSVFKSIESPNGDTGSTKLVTHLSTFPNPDDNPKTMWGQGTRYGCRPVAHGDIIIGYVKYGGTCPK